MCSLCVHSRYCTGIQSNRHEGDEPAVLQDNKLTKGAALLCRVTCGPLKRASIAANGGKAQESATNDALAHADLCAYPEYILCYDGKAMQ